MRRNWQDLQFGGARQSLLLDIMLWSHMGCFVESCGVWIVEDSRWDMSGTSTKFVVGIFICWPSFCCLVVGLDYVREAIESCVFWRSRVFVVRFPSLPAPIC